MRHISIRGVKALLGLYDYDMGVWIEYDMTKGAYPVQMCR